jgi:boron transporter
MASSLTKLVSSLIAQGTEFPLRKPAGFHWDLFLLGLTTGISGLLGIPFPNGLIPQAPFHTSALCVKRRVVPENENDKGKAIIITDQVVEQRVSNLAQGLLTLGTMSPPILKVLHLIPQGVLAGLFFTMGIQALQANGITRKLVFLAQDKDLTSDSNPLKGLSRRSASWYFVILELVGFGATFAITQTVAAIGFPVFILLLIPVRAFLLPRWFNSEELAALDEPTASSFTMESAGGTYGFDKPIHSTSISSKAVDSSPVVLSGQSLSHGRESGVSQTPPERAVEDELERGELYELHSTSSIRRRGATNKLGLPSHSEFY